MKIFLSKIYLLNILIIATLSFTVTTVKSQVNVLWESRYTSAGSQEDAGKEIAIDSAGNVYVTGTSYTNATNGYDIVTIKYNASGAQQWLATYNGSGNTLDEGRDIAVDLNGNVYVTGYAASTGPNYDYITIMYNSSGAQQWATLYDGTASGYDEAYGIAVDITGNCYVTGSSDATGASSNFVTIKYDNTGSPVWTSSYNGPGNLVDAATQIKLDASFDVYVSGHSYGVASDLDIATVKYDNALGTQSWVSRYDGGLNLLDLPQALYVDNSNNVYVAGARFGGLATQDDFVTIKIDNTGTQDWAQTYDGPANLEDQAFDIVADQNQDVYVTGRSMGLGGTAENMVTIKYNSSGAVLWQDTYNGPNSGYDDAQQMRIGKSGSLYVTGYSSGTGTNNDYLTLKYDTANAAILWEARFDGPSSNSDQAFAMEIDTAESIYVTGTSTDGSSFKDYSTIKWCQLSTDAGNDVEICDNASIQLSASSVGGSNFVWSPTSGLSDPNIANPIASPNATTTYTVSSSNALGCIDYDTIVVTVNPLPSNGISANGPIVFCASDSVLLTADSTQTYLWTPGNLNTRSIMAYSAGTYTVLLTDSNNCTNTEQVTITVDTIPTVSAGSDANICAGASLMLNATGATTYTWNTQIDLSDSTIANPIVNPTTPTTFWVVGSNASGCQGSDSVIIAISVTPTAVISTPVPNDSLYLLQPNGGDIQFFGNTSTNVLVYDWDFGDGGTDNIDNPTYTYLAAGTWPVELITSNGNCHDTSSVTIWVFNSTDVEELGQEIAFNLLPNPASNQIKIKSTKVYEENLTLNIFNYAGQKVKSFNFNGSEMTINIQDLPNGLYFIPFKTDGKLITKKFTVSR